MSDRMVRHTRDQAGSRGVRSRWRNLRPARKAGAHPSQRVAPAKLRSPPARDSLNSLTSGSGRRGALGWGTGPDVQGEGAAGLLQLCT